MGSSWRDPWLWVGQLSSVKGPPAPGKVPTQDQGEMTMQLLLTLSVSFPPTSLNRDRKHIPYLPL